MSDRPVRLAHLVSHPIQYFAPLYRELAARPEIDLTVYFYSDASLREFHDPEFGRSVRWDTPLLDGYRSKLCPSAGRAEIEGGFVRRPNWDIIREVASGRYDVVWVHGYAHPTTWLAALAARTSGACLLIRDEQTLLHGRPAHRRLVKEVALRILFSQASGLYIGEQNRRHFRHYGMQESRLFPAPYCVDNRYLRERAAELALRRRELAEAFGITDGSPVVLYCGKFTEKKQPLLLLEAFAKVRARQPCWLLMVGDGPLHAAAEDLAARRGIPDVRMVGFLNQTELPAAYVVGDVFVLPSGLHETWGLVVNEAMNFSLPVIVSDKVGCAEDLVRSGWNGCVVPHRSVAALANAIDALVADESMRRVFGLRSRELVAKYDIAAAAEGIVAACLARGRREVAEAGKAA